MLTEYLFALTGLVTLIVGWIIIAGIFKAMDAESVRVLGSASH